MVKVGFKRLKKGGGAVKRATKKALFKRYNRVKYMMRVKHWRGHSVHSPFAYNLIRRALMCNKSNFLQTSDSLYFHLLDKGIGRDTVYRVCRVFSYLDMRRFTGNCQGYDGEDMVCLLDLPEKEDFERLSDKIAARGGCVCVVFFDIYELNRHKFWIYVQNSFDVVTIDMFKTGLIFFNRDLLKQHYKIKI